MQLLPYADAHDHGLFDELGGIEKMGYERGMLGCRDLTGDGTEMIVRMQWCTGGSPSPWGSLPGARRLSDDGR